MLQGLQLRLLFRTDWIVAIRILVLMMKILNLIQRKKKKNLKPKMQRNQDKKIRDILQFWERGLVSCLRALTRDEFVSYAYRIKHSLLY